MRLRFYQDFNGLIKFLEKDFKDFVSFRCNLNEFNKSVEKFLNSSLLVQQVFLIIFKQGFELY